MTDLLTRHQRRHICDECVLDLEVTGTMPHHCEDCDDLRERKPNRARRPVMVATHEQEPNRYA